MKTVTYKFLVTLLLLMISSTSFAFVWTSETDDFVFTEVPMVLEHSYTRNFDLSSDPSWTGGNENKPYDFADSYGLDFTALDMNQYVVNIIVNEQTSGNIKLEDLLGNDYTITNSLTLTALSFAAGKYQLDFSGNAKDGDYYSFAVSAVPLPPTVLLLLTSLAGIGLVARRKN